MPLVENALVVSADYSTHGNYGRRLASLENGWLVAALQEGQVQTRFYVSKDDGLTWIEQVRSAGNGSGLAITAIGNTVYMVGTNSNTQVIRCFAYDFKNSVVVVDNLAVLVETSASYGQGISLIANDDGSEIHLTWASRHSGFPSSHNTRYARGVIAPDGSVAWDRITQVTRANSGNLNFLYPTISLTAAGNPLITCSATEYTTYRIICLTTEFTSKQDLASSIDPLWGEKSVYSISTHQQQFPVNIKVPQSVNGLAQGRIWVAWQGRDVGTDQAIQVSFSDDSGLNWSEREKVSTGAQNVFPSLTAARDGKVSVLYAHYTPDAAIAETSYNGTSWGTTIYTGAGRNNPSALYHLGLDVQKTLFLSSSTTGVRFSGEWNSTSISVPTGDIGNKNTSLILDYHVTSDAVIGPVIEKINGVTIATKTLLSGEPTSVTLTKAQLDAIAFGRYSSSDTTRNTLTIETGAYLWSYTFSKQLNPSADVEESLRAVSDIRNVVLPAIKNGLATAINMNGGSSLPTDSWVNLIRAVNGGAPIGNFRNNGHVITPSTVNQAIPEGYHDGLGYVVGSPNLQPTNIKNGVNIFGVVGTV